MDLRQRAATDTLPGLTCLPACHSVSGQSFLMSRGKAAVGDGGRGLLTLVYNLTETPSLSPHSPGVYCNLIKLNN